MVVFRTDVQFSVDMIVHWQMHCKQKCGHTVVIRVIWGDLTCSGQGFVHRMTTSSIQAMSVDSAATIWPQDKIINNICQKLTFRSTLWPPYGYSPLMKYYFMRRTSIFIFVLWFWASTLDFVLCIILTVAPRLLFCMVHRSSQLQHHNLQCTA